MKNNMVRRTDHGAILNRFIWSLLMVIGSEDLAVETDNCGLWRTIFEKYYGDKTDDE